MPPGGLWWFWRWAAPFPRPRPRSCPRRRLGWLVRRLACNEREDWQATAEASGFDFHTIDGARYWDERAFYAFTLAEIEDRIEAPTGEIDAMCLELCAHVIADERRLKR